MPLTEKGKEIMQAMKEQYGEEKGEQVFHASKNKGTISGVDNAADSKMHTTDAVSGLDNIANATRITHVGKDYGPSFASKDAEPPTLNWAGGEHAVTHQTQGETPDCPKDVSGVE